MPRLELGGAFYCRLQFNGYGGYHRPGDKAKSQGAFHLTEWKRPLPYTRRVVVISSPRLCCLDSL